MTITPAEIAALRAADAERTQGEWQEGIAGPANIVQYDGDDIRGIGRVNYPPNARAIVLAVNNLGALLREIERLNSEEQRHRRATDREFDRAEAAEKEIERLKESLASCERAARAAIKNYQEERESNVDLRARLARRDA